MSNETSGLDLSHVSEIPGGDALQTALNNFNKKAAGAGFKVFKRVLGTVTEPFFRVGMGERYYTPETHRYGIAFWIIATIIAVLFPYFSSLAWPLCELVGLSRLSPIFEYHIPAVVAGGFMIFTQWKFGRQSFRLVAQYRSEGNAYHTRSRGLPRAGISELPAFFTFEGFLLLFNLPCAVLFFLGYMMNAKIKAEQDAAIISRYLDKLDEDVENQYLEDAALGNCPTEITYLRKPLPQDMSPQMRNGVAASLVGKPAMGIARRRQQPGSAQSGTPPSGGATAPAANYQSAPSSPKTASSATAVASPARPAKGSRQDAPQSRTTSTQTDAPQPNPQVFSREMLAFLERSVRPEVVAELVRLKATIPTFPSDEVVKNDIKGLESTILLTLRAAKLSQQRGPQTQGATAPDRVEVEFSQSTMDDLKQICSAGLLARFVELKATQPDFPCDVELICRIGDCMNAGFYRGKDYQAVAERVLKHELTPEVAERMENGLRRDTQFQFAMLRFRRKDLPPEEEFERKLAACSVDELKAFNAVDERIEMVLGKD